MVSVANTDPDIIEAIEECLTVLGIPYKRNHTAARGRHQAIETIHIYGQSALSIIHAEVPIRSKRKADRLAGLLNNNRRRHDLTSQFLKADELRAAYVTMTQKQMAAHFGVSLSTIVKAMNRHAIPRVLGSERAARVWESRRGLYGPSGRSQLQPVVVPHVRQR